MPKDKHKKEHRGTGPSQRDERRREDERRSDADRQRRKELERQREAERQEAERLEAERNDWKTLVSDLRSYTKHYAPSYNPVTHAVSQALLPSRRRLPTGRELSKLVEEHCRAVDKPGNPEVSQLGMLIWYLYEQPQTGYDEIKDFMDSKAIYQKLDDVLSFGLLRRLNRNHKPLVELVIKKGTDPNRHGKFSNESCRITLYVSPSSLLGDVIGCLWHEMAHALHFIFSSDLVTLDGTDREIHHKSWYKTCRFGLDLLRG